MKLKFPMAVISAVFFLFVAGSSRVAYAAPPTDACSLLTPAQASAALGTPVTAGKPFFPNSTKECGWPPPGGAIPPKRVFLEITNPTHWGVVKMPAPKGVVKTPVSGIGDDAVYVVTSGIGTALYVKKGDFVFQVRVYGFPPEEIKAKEKTLAQDVLAKL